MDDAVYKKYKLAGKIAADARDYGATLIKTGVSFLEVADKVESKILNSGAGLSFPVNISVNELAAHYSPRHDDKLTFKKGDVVKLDVGTHVDGYIADTAITIEVETDNYKDMIKASSEALDTAIGLMKANIDLSKLGKEVKETINSFGFKPIDNLTGHSLQKYTLHAGMSIPSVPDISGRSKPKKDDVVAIEPFATNGAGHVVSGNGSNIYLCNQTFKSKIIRDKRSRATYNKMMQEFKTLPFAQRWSEKLIQNNDMFLRKLSFLGLLKHYPQLIDSQKGIVTQKEHTVIVTEDGCEVTT
jgi:methionyl aminopeptidase